MNPQCDPKDFQKVIQSADIREVFMVSSNCKCYVHYTFVNPKETALEVKKKRINTELIIDSKKRNTGIILSKIDFTIEGISQKAIQANLSIKKGDPLFTISASFIAIYTVKDTNLNKKAIQYFGTENAFFNVHPYLREFVTSISQRLNLSPVVLPLLKPSS